MKKLYLSLLIFLPQFLAACPMCLDSTGYSDKSRNAYYLITVILGIIPVSIGIGIGLYVKSRAKNNT